MTAATRRAACDAARLTSSEKPFNFDQRVEPLPHASLVLRKRLFHVKAEAGTRVGKHAKEQAGGGGKGGEGTGAKRGEGGEAARRLQLKAFPGSEPKRGCPQPAHLCADMSVLSWLDVYACTRRGKSGACASRSCSRTRYFSPSVRPRRKCC